MKKPNLVFIHGWAGSPASWLPISRRLEGKFKIFAPQLPFPKGTILTLDSYCTFLLKYIKKHKITSPILIGHSLGGAIATKIAATHPKLPQAIILLSAASLRHPIPQPWRTIRQLTKPFQPLLKPFRHLLLQLTRLDASDYEVLHTPIEKKTFQNLLAADQTTTLPQITCPTLILWGENDTSTFVSDGQKIHQLIPQSKLKIYPNSGHFFFIDYQNDIANTISHFISHET